MMTLDRETSLETEIYMLFGFQEKQEAERIVTFVNKLRPHFIDNEYCFVGGLAIRYHVIRAGQTYPSRPLHDIDIIVTNPSSVLPSIAEQVMVAHHHVSTTNFFLKVVDPETKLKADIFGPHPNVD